MKVIFSDEQMRHNPEKILSSGALVDSPENPGRAESLLQAAIASGLDLVIPEDCGLEPLAAVHTSRYLTFLETIHTRWLRIPGASKDVLPNVHPEFRNCLYPASAVGQVGYHVFDGAAPITADTWNSALWSSYSAVQAAREVLRGECACYALARPPGHHAAKDMAGGFCYLNNLMSTYTTAMELKAFFTTVMMCLRFHCTLILCGFTRSSGAGRTNAGRLPVRALILTCRWRAERVMRSTSSHSTGRLRESTSLMPVRW
jgi:acetoin utilization deacetylase AcuC-like enzyme